MNKSSSYLSLSALFCVVLCLMQIKQLNCMKQMISLAGVDIEWENLGSQTQFWAKTQLNSRNPSITINPNNAWLAVGINNMQSMVIHFSFK